MRARQIVAALLLPGIAGALASGAPASTQPQFGGTLRVQISERVTTIDPRQWPSESTKADAAERVNSLVFDRLVRLDDHARLQPALAISWEHDPPGKRWQFRIREGVKFSDGTALTPAIAAMALQQLLGVSFDVSATADSVVIQADRSLPELATELSTGRYFIFRTGADNAIVGTGAFRVAEWPVAEASAKAVFVANETCWVGRPFVDKIELLMGAGPDAQANAISFDQADVVELPASQVRRVAQRNIRTASSDPVEVCALVIDESRPTLKDARLRQAISLAIDRASIADVILQKQGVAAGGLLPNWISGYAHLLPPTFDLPRAKDLLTASRHEPSRPVSLVLVYDSGDAELRAVADRVAVNLREAGIMIQVSGQHSGGLQVEPAPDSGGLQVQRARDSGGLPFQTQGKQVQPAPAAGGKSKAITPDLRLVRHHLGAPDPALALSQLLNSLGEATTGLETLEQVYDAERAPIEAYRVIPLVHISESYGLSTRVRDWMPPRWGGWRLDEVWLGPATVAGGNSQ
jgi:peptide/nickel transport system substrate-binding protein